MDDKLMHEWEYEPCAWAFGLTAKGSVAYLKADGIGLDRAKAILRGRGCVKVGQASKPVNELTLVRRFIAQGIKHTMGRFIESETT